jgi:anti-sigma28 factor (negative regulator of flagellin synthesis)
MDVSRIGPGGGHQPPRPVEPGRPAARSGPVARPGAGGRAPGREDLTEAGGVSVSPQVRLILALHQAMRNAQEIRPEVVADLKARIAAGQYAVDEFELARLLVKGNEP